MNVHDARYEYTFNNNPKNPIKLDEFTQLLPLLIDAWATLKAEEINLQIIPITSRLHTQISTFPENENGLKRHFKDKKQRKEQAVFGSFSRSPIFQSSKRSNTQKLFAPKKNITVEEIVQLLPLLTEAWNNLNTYEPGNHKKIPQRSVLYEKLDTGEFSQEGLGRHFESVPINGDIELSLQYGSTYKYLFDPKFDPKNDIITAYDLAQVLPILIESWGNKITNELFPSNVEEKRILPVLNDKIYNLSEQTREKCFTNVSYPDSESVV